MQNWSGVGAVKSKVLFSGGNLDFKEAHWVFFSRLVSDEILDVPPGPVGEGSLLSLKHLHYWSFPWHCTAF